MILRHRSMRTDDIQACVELVKADPVVGPRYGDSIQHLPAAWRRLLECESTTATVFLADDGHETTICFVGVSLVVTDEFLADLKRAPHAWIGPHVVRQTISGSCPAVSGKEWRDGNSRGGLNLLCWEACFARGYGAQNAELQRYVMATFIDQHRGYLWKELISTPATDVGHLEFLFRSGAHLWDGLRGCYATAVQKPLEEIVKKPHVLGIHRDLEIERQRDWWGTWVGALFDYHCPVLGLSRSEQRMLSSALSGATDDELARALGVSLPAVKKLWVSVYERVEARLPNLIPSSTRFTEPANSRGKEKRRRVLAYLRDHVEELRPVTRRLLPTAARTQVRANRATSHASR